MLKSLIRTSFRYLGYEVRRSTPVGTPTRQLALALSHFGIDTVLDVGANVGQFATELRKGGFNGKIISFEPLSDAHRQLVARSARDNRWIVHSRVAIGDMERNAEIHVAGNSVSSSLLNMTEAHSDAALGSAYVGTETVPMQTLTGAASAYLAVESNALLKIDTQGYEWQVLDGAHDILPQIQGVLCEVSFVELYSGQRLWTDVIGRLHDEGFTLWSLMPGFIDRRNGRTLQLDAVLFRPRSS
jgi:FkbM family methyltransferase